MTLRKIPLFAAAVCAAALIGATTTSAQQTAVGGGLVYGTDMDPFDLGLQGNVYVAIPGVPGLRAGGDLTYYLPQNDLNFLAINGNAQYYFMSAPELALYGLAGVSVGRISNGGSVSDTGFNLGIGGEFMVGFGAIYGEAKLVTGDFDRVVIGAGIRIPIM